MNLCWLVAHTSHAAAVRHEAELRAMQAAVYGTPGPPCKPYRCPRCLTWHVRLPRPHFFKESAA